MGPASSEDPAPMATELTFEALYTI